MHRFKLLNLLILFLSVGIGVAYAADDDPISPERPGYTNGTDTVPVGHIQFETGYSFSHDTGGSRQHTLGDGMQVRYPLTQNVEARLGLPAYFWTHDPSGSANGFGDSSLSMKYRFLEAPSKPSIRPALALIGGVELKTGAKAFREDDYQPSLALESDWSLGGIWGLTGDIVYNGIRQGGVRYDEWSGGLCLNVTLTPRWGTFAEVYRVSDSGAGDTQATFADTGLTYRIGANTIIDINGGGGLTGAKDSYFLGGGIARRW